MARNALYLCDAESKIQQVQYIDTGVALVTCNGVTVSTNDKPYNITFIDNEGNRLKEEVSLTKYTEIRAYSNGNTTLFA